MTRLIIMLVFLTASFGLAGGKFSSGSSNSSYSKKVSSAENKSIRLSRLNFEDSIKSLYQRIGLQKIGMNYDAFRYGMIGYYSLKHDRKLSNKGIVSFIDFTRPSTEKRFYTVDLDNVSVKFHSLVSHGKNTGENVATSFSNMPHSNQSSLGFYITGEAYFGSKGYSLRLDGADGTYNNNMRSRAVVMHDADYVSENWIRRYGRLGRSQGCPALPKEISKLVIDSIKEKTLVFAYFNDGDYLKSSTHLNLEKLFVKLESVAEL